ncbi:hypothetical protein GQ53DRAFT_847712 [Thozetella sp. PMI_491]|nr:hypothetical protein GQ53DRAFT_847712 [Thozetella sp. PMI_491]
MAEVPTFKTEVVGWSEDDERIANNLRMEVWLVTSKVGDMSARIWFKQGSLAFQELCQHYSVAPNDIDTVHVNTGFVKGKLLRENAIGIATSGGQNRPPFLWLVTCQDTPHGGLRAGRDLSPTTTPFFFQLFFQKHVSCSVTQVRQESAFIHLTNNHYDAIASCAHLETEGRVGISILRIDTTNGGWNFAVQRMWDARVTCVELGLRGRCCKPGSYLVEHSIPDKAVVETTKWESLRMLPLYRQLLNTKAVKKKHTKKMAAARAAACAARGKPGPRKTFKRCKGFTPIQPHNQEQGQAGQV